MKTYKIILKGEFLYDVENEWEAIEKFAEDFDEHMDMGAIVKAELVK